MAVDRSASTTAQATTPAPPGAQALGQPPGAHGHPVRAADRYSLGVPAAGDGLRVGHELLASPARLAAAWGVDPRTPRAALQAPRGGPDRLVAGGGRLDVGAGGFWGAKTGP